MREGGRTAMHMYLDAALAKNTALSLPVLWVGKGRGGLRRQNADTRSYIRSGVCVWEGENPVWEPASSRQY